MQRPNDTKEEANLNAKEKKCCFDNLDNQVEEKTIMPSYRPQPSREKVWVLFQLAAERFTDISLHFLLEFMVSFKKNLCYTKR